MRTGSRHARRREQPPSSRAQRASPVTRSMSARLPNTGAPRVSAGRRTAARWRRARGRPSTNTARVRRPRLRWLRMCVCSRPPVDRGRHLQRASWPGARRTPAPRPARWPAGRSAAARRRSGCHARASPGCASPRRDDAICTTTPKAAATTFDACAALQPLSIKPMRTAAPIQSPALATGSRRPASSRRRSSSHPPGSPRDG